MAECTSCRAVTELYDDGTPICPHCYMPENRQLMAKLLRNLGDAKIAAEAASAEFQAITSHIPSGIPHPDGTQRIRNASLRMKSTRDQMITAHWRLSNFLEHGIVPKDLKR